MYQGDAAVSVAASITSRVRSLPTAVRFQVHGTELPALGRIFNSREEALALFLLRYFEPILQKDDAWLTRKLSKMGQS